MKAYRFIFIFFSLIFTLESCGGDAQEDSDNVVQTELDKVVQTEFEEEDTTKSILPLFEDDSLELLWIYKNTNPENWETKWDITQPARTWHGVEVNLEGRVNFVNLTNNNLTGDISSINMADHISFNFDFKGNPFKAYYASTSEGLIREYNIHSMVTNSFKIKDTVAYVLRSNLPLYANQNGTEEITVLEEFETVFGNFNYSDKSPKVFEGFKGDYVYVKTKDTSGYVFSGYLSKLLPNQAARNNDWLAIENSYLDGRGVQLLGERFTPVDGEYTWNYYYKYEYGIEVWDEDGWEWGGSRISLPYDLFTCQEAYLIGGFFIEDYFTIFENRFPDQTMLNKDYPKGTEVRLDFNAGNEFVGFEINIGDEYYMTEIKFEIKDGYYVIESFF